MTLKQKTMKGHPLGFKTLKKEVSLGAGESIHFKEGLGYYGAKTDADGVPDKARKAAAQKAVSSSSPAPVAQKAAESASGAGATAADLISNYNLERAKILGSLPGQINSIYGNAVQGIGDVAGGATEDVRKHLYEVGQGKAAAFGQIDPRIAESYNINSAPDASKYLGVQLPSDTLSQQGKGFAAASVFQQGAALQEGQYALQKAINDAKVTNAEASKVSASVSKLVGYISDAYGNPIGGKNGKPVKLPEPGLTPYQKASLTLRAGQIDYGRYKDDRAYAQKVDAANRSDKRYYAGLQLREVSTKLAIQKAGIDAGRIDAAASKVAGHIVLKDGTTPKQKNGQPYAVAKTTKAASPSANAKLDETVAQWKAGGKPVRVGSRTKRDADTGQSETTYTTEVKGKPMNYQVALRKLRSQYGLTLNAAQDVLDTHYNRGEQGRPLVSFQEAREFAKPKYRKWGITPKLLQQARGGGRTQAAIAASHAIQKILAAHGISWANEPDVG